MFSQTLQGKDDNVEFVTGDLKDFINRLRQASGGDIWLVGGGQIIDYFLRYRFIDELILAIHPIILGDGIPLFIRDSNLQTLLSLQNVKSYDSGLVQISYIIKNSALML